MWAVFLKHILFVSRQVLMTKTQGLQRKDYKAARLQKKIEQKNFEISQYLKYYKVKVFTKCRSSHSRVLYKKRF